MGDLRRLVVFDLDGTLIDSRRDLAAAANALIVERGGAPLPEEAVARMVGDGATMLVRRALDAAALPFDDRCVPRFLALYDERLLHTTTVYPGIPDALQALAPGGPLAVLTNKPFRHTRTLLDALGLAPFFASVLGGDGPLPRKPDPAGLLQLMRELGSAPPRTVFVGDSRVDFETARAAGTAICLARYGFGYETFPTAALRGGEAFADQPRDLPAAIDALLDRRTLRLPYTD